MPNRGTLNWSGSNTTYSVPAGYYSRGTIDSRPSYTNGYNAGKTEGKTITKYEYSGTGRGDTLSHTADIAGCYVMFAIVYSHNASSTYEITLLNSNTVYSSGQVGDGKNSQWWIASYNLSAGARIGATLNQGYAAGAKLYVLKIT